MIISLHRLEERISRLEKKWNDTEIVLDKLRKQSKDHQENTEAHKA